MKDLFKPLAAASVMVLLAGVAGCNDDRSGDHGAANAKVAELQQQLSRAQQDTEKALTRNTVLQSRLKALEAAAASTVVAETVAVETVADAFAPVSDELAALQAELAKVTEERDRMHDLLEENEAALRDGLAKSAQRQQLMDGMEEQLSATRQVAEATADRLALAEEQITVMQGELSGGQKKAKASVAQMVSLQEQLVAMQADKAALESRLAEQDEQMLAARSEAAQAQGKVSTLEKTLASARAHGNSLAEQLAAIQADTHKLEAQLVEAGNQRRAADTRAQALVADAVASAKLVDNGNDGQEAATAAEKLRAALLAAQQEEARLRDRANAAEQRGADMELQLKGALSQTKALQQEVAGLRRARIELEAEIQSLEVADVVVSRVDSSALEVSDAVEIQTLLEEGQALLEACNASLGSGAEQMFELEQQALGMRNALERQRRVTASRCNRMSATLEAAMAENQRLRSVLSGALGR